VVRRVEQPFALPLLALQRLLSFRESGTLPRSYGASLRCAVQSFHAPSPSFLHTTTTPLFARLVERSTRTQLLPGSELAQIRSSALSQIGPETSSINVEVCTCLEHQATEAEHKYCLAIPPCSRRAKVHRRTLGKESVLRNDVLQASSRGFQCSVRRHVH